MDKPELRRHIRALKQQHTREECSLWSASLYKALEAHPRFQTACNVMLFSSLPDEPDTAPLLMRYAGSKNLYLPAVVGDNIEVRRYRGHQDLRQGAFGISEPVGEPLLELSLLDLVVVPGVAFDLEGHRLGRGCGFYDRFFSQAELQAYRLGYAYPFQIVSHVPTDHHDVVMDEVLTMTV